MERPVAKARQPVANNMSHPNSEDPVERDGGPVTLGSWLKTSRPWLVQLAIVLIGVQALVLALYAVWALYELVTGKAEYIPVAVSLILCSALVSWLLVAIVRGIGDQRPWVRGPAFTVEILLILVGISILQSGVVSWGLILLLYGLCVCVLLAIPPVSRYIGVRELRQD